MTRRMVFFGKKGGGYGIIQFWVMKKWNGYGWPHLRTVTLLMAVVVQMSVLA
jgi:hypothetical protein